MKRNSLTIFLKLDVLLKILTKQEGIYCYKLVLHSLSSINIFNSFSGCKKLYYFELLQQLNFEKLL